MGTSEAVKNLRKDTLKKIVQTDSQLTEMSPESSAASVSSEKKLEATLSDQDSNGKSTGKENLEKIIRDSQVIISGNRLLKDPSSLDATIATSQVNKTVEVSLYSSIPVAVNVLLVFSIVLLLAVKSTLSIMPYTSLYESLSVFIVFLIATAVYVSPALRKFVPTVVRVVGGFMIGVLFMFAIQLI